jgi:glycolate oxidase FAD binding subunit
VRRDSDQEKSNSERTGMTAAADVPCRLAEVIGAKRVIAALEALAAYAVDGLTPSAIVRPATAGEVAEVVQFAAAEKLAVLPLGSRSKCELGMQPLRYDIAMDMTGLRGIAHFDAGDLTLSVDAGMPLRELEMYLKANGQFLPLAVPCFESTTAGGAIASGIDSAVRLQYGTARDFLLGAEFVDGTGQLCKSGGRVVKNVTGYDLHKLLIGSLGTLGVITRVNFRTFPLPATSGGHIAGFATNAAALGYRNAVEKVGLPLSNLEVLSPGVVDMVRAILHNAREPFPAELEREEWSVYSSFEGGEEVVRRVAAELEQIATETSARQSRILEKTEDQALGGILREAFEWLRWASPVNVICRLALPEVKAGTLTELSQLAESGGLRMALLVRATGIVYFAAFAESEDEPATSTLAKITSNVSVLAGADKGYSTLLHAPLAVKKEVARARRTMIDLALQKRVKQTFDPWDVFAPGRIVGGI